MKLIWAENLEKFGRNCRYNQLQPTTSDGKQRTATSDTNKMAEECRAIAATSMLQHPAKIALRCAVYVVKPWTPPEAIFFNPLMKRAVESNNFKLKSNFSRDEVTSSSPETTSSKSERIPSRPRNSSASTISRTSWMISFANLINFRKTEVNFFSPSMKTEGTSDLASSVVCVGTFSVQSKTCC
jgi:hypothetical protein